MKIGKFRENRRGGYVENLLSSQFIGLDRDRRSQVYKASRFTIGELSRAPSVHAWSYLYSCCLGSRTTSRTMGSDSGRCKRREPDRIVVWPSPHASNSSGTNRLSGWFDNPLSTLTNRQAGKT
jgi:hypothetical protein